MKQVHNYLDLSLTEINKLLKEKTITPKDLVLEAFERVEQNKDLNSFITLNKEEAIKLLKDFSVNYTGSGKYVKEQSPNANTRLKEGGKIRLLLGD